MNKPLGKSRTAKKAKRTEIKALEPDPYAFIDKVFVPTRYYLSGRHAGLVGY
jgi:hypothetical protein